MIRLIISFCGLFLYWDTTRYKIGKVKGEKGFLNMPAGSWAFSGMILGPLALALYWSNRQKLIVKARDNPAEVGIPQKIIVYLLLALPALDFLLMPYIFAAFATG